MTKLEDLEFANDLALLSHRLQDMQDKVAALETTAQRVLKISQEKTKLLRTNINQQEAPVTISGKAVEDVGEFVYLDSKMSQTGGTYEDIKARVKKTRQAHVKHLKPVWRATTISTNTKLRIFNSNVKSVLFYGSETWRAINTSTAKIQTFINGCLRQILHLRWFDRVPNTDLWTRANQQPMDVQVRRRKWRWVGHTLRKEPCNITRQALELNPQGKRKRGRPKQTWRRSLHCELRDSGLTWEEAKTCARDRVRGRRAVEALCFSRSQKD
nr:hypothetical protein BaRGS_007664 [Batillaria attramentaria]